jgi:hypothetical protein
VKLRSRDHEDPELNVISLVDVVLGTMTSVETNPAGESYFPRGSKLVSVNSFEDGLK